MYTAYCPLPNAYSYIAYCLLPTATFLLSFAPAYLLLPAAYCLLPAAYCPLKTAYCLRVVLAACHLLPNTDWQLPDGLPTYVMPDLYLAHDAG
jgi:hypothetical protein